MPFDLFVSITTLDPPSCCYAAVLSVLTPVLWERPRSSSFSPKEGVVVSPLTLNGDPAFTARLLSVVPFSPMVETKTSVRYS